MATPPAALTTKSTATSPAVTVVPIAAIASEYAVRPVPSLTSDSPSRIVRIRVGAPSRAITAAAATGSVGPTTAPSTNASGQGRPIRWCAARATATTVTSTRPTASRAIGPALARSSYADAWKAAA
jgi:hypothetical protein